MFRKVLSFLSIFFIASCAFLNDKHVYVPINSSPSGANIYIDGQLASSCVLKRFPKINTKDVELTPDGGFSGMISRVKFTNAAMTIQQAKNIYYEGPIFSESLFSIVPNWVYWGLLILIIVSIGYLFI